MGASVEAIVLGVHIVGAAVWVGGSIALGVVASGLRTAPDLDETARLMLTSRIARRLGWIMWPALLISIITGFYNLTWFLAGGLTSLGSSSDLVLQAKMGLVGFVVVVSGLHSFVVGPGVRHFIGNGQSDEHVRRLRRLNGVLGSLSLVGSVAILLLAAALPFYG